MVIIKGLRYLCCQIISVWIYYLLLAISPATLPMMLMALAYSSEKKSDRIWLTVQYSSEQKHFLMARWTSSGLFFFPIVSPFSNALKRKAFWAALNRNVDPIVRPHPSWRNNWITAPNVLEAGAVGEDVTNEWDRAARIIRLANDFFT